MGCFSAGGRIISASKKPWGCVNTQELNRLPCLGGWSFEEGAGSVVYDSSGNDHNGAIVNSVSWGIGKSKKCLTLPSGSYVDIGSIAEAGAISDFSISLWAKPSCAPANSYVQGGLVASKTWSTGKIALSIKGTTTGYYRFYTNVYGQVSDAFTSTKVDCAYGAWCHVVWTHAHATKKDCIFIDGVQDGYKNFSGYPYISTVDLTIGNFLSRYFIGDIDEVRFFNSAIDQATVTALYSNPRL